MLIVKNTEKAPKSPTFIGTIFAHSLFFVFAIWFGKRALASGWAIDQLILGIGFYWLLFVGYRIYRRIRIKQKQKEASYEYKAIF